MPEPGARIELHAAGHAQDGLLRYAHVIRLDYELSPAQLAALRRRAEQAGVGVAELLRRAVEAAAG